MPDPTPAPPPLLAEVERIVNETPVKGLSGTAAEVFIIRAREAILAALRASPLLAGATAEPQPAATGSEAADSGPEKTDNAYQQSVAELLRNRKRGADAQQ